MTISYRKDGLVGVVTLDRPDVFNCLNLETLTELRKLIAELARDRSTRVVIVTGAGDKAFCSGADLKERRGMSPEQVEVYIRTIRDTFSELE
ncbi:enoyl-CoA hydratase, partial [Mesorhizobium sp. M00.F.Ca.ET.186.01.1.1]